MKILHIIKERTPSGSVHTIIEDQSEAGGSEVTVVNMHEDKDYAKLVGLIFSSDKIYSW